jgi:predicted component of type VI protein secretion system
MRTRSTERRAATAVFCAARAEWRISAPSEAPGGTAARLAEDRHDAQAEDDEARTERLHIDELGARDEQAAEREQDERNPHAPVAEEARERRVDLVADVPSVPAEPERDGEEDAQEDEREPDELGMLLRAPALRARALGLPHARWGLRA